jgi:peptide/nickel transport system substrate-binding protein
VSRIDTRSTSVTRTIRVGQAPGAISAAGDEVWVADRETDDVRGIDVHSGLVDRVLHVARSPAGVAAQGDDVWVSVGEASSEHRGGTLRAVGYEDLRTLDPARTYGQFAWDIESVLHDGLVTFQRTGGPSGAIVVPDLAARLPQISADGLTYTFQLRRGIRYSTGAPVLARDVRASFERILRSPTAPPYYGDILGGSACSPTKPRCDLSRGIRIDDATGLVQFVLSRPDPDFVEQLAIPSADVLPAGVTDRDLGYAPRPTTGPYVISSESSSSVTLGRNPRFVPWSAAAQPAGYPDHIVITLRPGTGLHVSTADARATIAGTFDWSATPVRSTLLTELIKTKTSQVHAFSDNSVRYFFLNTTRAPFDDVRVRRAVNLGVDRGAALAALGGAHGGTTTCQSLPPSLPGYRPICPYTARPDSSGTWKAPDLAAARALVRQAHASGRRVRVVVPTTGRAVGRVLVRGMRAIGLDATLVVYRRPGVTYDAYLGDYYDYLGTRSAHVQSALEGWVVDYPAPSNLFGPLLRCSARTPTGNIDESEFCDHAIDRQMDAAAAQETTNPTAAGVKWAGIDWGVTRQAPWVPLVNGRVYDAVSARLGNFQANPELGMLIDQAWVR